MRDSTLKDTPVDGNSDGTENRGHARGSDTISFNVTIGFTSSFGLYDTAGGTSEWTELALGIPGEPYPRDRGYYGTARDTPPYGNDRLVGLGSEYPTFLNASLGLRIASVVPAPATTLLITLAAPLYRRRRSPTTRHQ